MASRCADGKEQACDELLSRIAARDPGVSEDVCWTLEMGCPDSPRACRVLGVARRDGVGVQKDFALALVQFKKGCAKQDSGSCTEAAELYRRGQGVPVDMRQAEEYLKLGRWMRPPAFEALARQ